MSLQASQAACRVFLRASGVADRRPGLLPPRGEISPVVPIRPVNEEENVLLTVSVSTVDLWVIVPVSARPGNGRQSLAASCSQHCLSPHPRLWAVLPCSLHGAGRGGLCCSETCVLTD